MNCSILGFTSYGSRFLASKFTSVILIFFLSFLNTVGSYLQELSFCMVNGLKVG